MVFDNFRHSFDDLLARATRPEERHLVASRMKDTLVQARMGLDDMRQSLDKVRQRLAVEEKELETIRRRKQLAEGIEDRETVDIATKYEEMHVERVNILRQKLSVQEAELTLAERDVGQMTAELKAVMSGTDPRGATSAIEPDLDGPGPSALREEIDSLGRARAQAEKESDAARRLEELKRKMGK
jgi:hypothetical protein